MQKAVMAVAALAMIAAACGGDGGDGATDGNGATEPDDGVAAAEDLSPEVEEAAAAAEEAGLQFVTSRDELMERAREQGTVVAQTSTAEFQPFEEAFEEEYDFLDLEWSELSGAASERFLLEAESGAAGRNDVGYPAPEAYDDIEAMMNWDLLGMAEAGILNIPPESIDQENRTVVAAGHTGIALAYNSELVSEEELPQSWEDLADPKWARDELGMAMDVDLNNVAVIAVHDDWDIDRVVQLMSDMAELQPIYTDGHTAASLLVQSGEVAISPFVNLHSLMREVDKDPEGPLQVHFVEPVPIRASEAVGIYDDSLAEAPHAGLLFVEWFANSDASQELLDADPLQASLYWEGSRMAEMIGDLDTAVAEPDEVAALPPWIQQLQDAAGFPSVTG